jgi:hypothetical protein
MSEKRSRQQRRRARRRRASGKDDKASEQHEWKKPARRRSPGGACGYCSEPYERVVFVKRNAPFIPTSPCSCPETHLTFLGYVPVCSRCMGIPQPRALAMHRFENGECEDPQECPACVLVDECELRLSLLADWFNEEGAEKVILDLGLTPSDVTRVYAQIEADRERRERRAASAHAPDNSHYQERGA